ncbi:MAG: hypothetical protein ACYC3L_12020 [Gemmatimonadaceae bacterium]
MHTPNSIARRPHPGVRALAVLAVLVVAAAACSDPFALKAQYSNMPFVYSLYGISGSGPANAPAALDFATQATVRVDGSFAFDVAFDFDGTGKIRVIPQKLVGAAISGARTVGLQRLTGDYASVLEAPPRGWQYDSTVTVLPGEVVGVRITSGSCLYQASTELYAKVVVDSVKAGGLIFGRGVMNPNCGFKSFADGIPKF